ncbi:pirin family protein [Pantoea sp. 1.19]|uniref:pirin family protein n=1 Tax=Pantoea sp. 1.19 TaxID=1925589 RepID=UPI00094911EA|nr:pirin family protein [Pantoea sp. 1.19]
MITTRTASSCGHADYGWLQARYSFSFGHYFDAALMGFGALRALNQEVLAPGAMLQPRPWPRVDVLNLVLQGDMAVRDSQGHYHTARAGDALLLAAHPGISYSEHNLSASQPLTRLQLWLDACPMRENPGAQHLRLPAGPGSTLIASPEGSDTRLQLRNAIHISHLQLAAGEQQSLPLSGSHAYLQSIYGSLRVVAASEQTARLQCGDAAFLRDEARVILRAETPMRALLIDLP